MSDALRLHGEFLRGFNQRLRHARRAVESLADGSVKSRLLREIQALEIHPYPDAIHELELEAVLDDAADCARGVLP